MEKHRQHVEKLKLKLKFFHNILGEKTGINKSIYLEEPHCVNSRQDNTKKIRRYQCRINVSKYSFFPNMIENWNTLPSDVVTANNFQTAIEDFFFLACNSNPSPTVVV